MTKRVNMSQPEQSDSHQRIPLWPFIIAGAAAGVLWSGVDPDDFKTIVTDPLRYLGSAIKPLFDILLASI